MWWQYILEYFRTDNLDKLKDSLNIGTILIASINKIRILKDQAARTLLSSF